MIPPIAQESFWIPRSAEDVGDSETLKQQFQIIQEVTKQLSTNGWAYLLAFPRTKSRAVTKEVIRRLQEEGYPVYTINEYYNWEMRKFMTVDHMWKRIYRTLEIVTNFSDKKPILFIDAKKNSYPVEPFVKIFKKAPFSIFSLNALMDAKVSNLFFDCVRKLIPLDHEAVLATCKRKFHKKVPPEVINLVVTQVESKLRKQVEDMKEDGEELGEEKKQEKETELIRDELYFRSKKILKQVVQLSASKQDVTGIMDRQNWEKRVYILRS